MKKTSFIILLLACGAFFACDNDDPAKSAPVRIDLQASFEQDNVQVFFDGKQLLNKILETNHTLGTTGEGLSLEAEEGNHQLKVVVNNTVTRQETFTLSNKIYIGINYDRQAGDVKFTYSDTPFAYD